LAVPESEWNGSGLVAQDAWFLPADGVTVIGDVRMPYAWRVGSARLTLLNERGVERWPLLDLARQPTCVIRGSTAVSPGGVCAHLMSEAHFLAGEDATGALVVLEPLTRPNRAVLTPILDRGGLGLVSDYAADRFAEPDTVPEILGVTENDNVLADCETRSFVGFAVSPRDGMRLRAMVASGTLSAQVECDAHRFVGEVRVTSCVVSGHCDEEVWIWIDQRMERRTTTCLRMIADVLRGTCPSLTVRAVLAPDPVSVAAAAVRWREAGHTVSCAYACRFTVEDRLELCRLPTVGQGRLLPARIRLGDLTDIGRVQPVRERGKSLEGVEASIPYEEVVFSRATPDLPDQLLRFPKARRPVLRTPLRESPLADVIAVLDGRSTLGEVIRAVETRRGRRFDGFSARRSALTLCRLAQAGYLTARNLRPVTRADVATALREAGVKEGDFLLVHASLSALGYLEDGARTVIDALRETVGTGGTVLFPAFPCAFRTLGVSCKTWLFRPFDPAQVSQLQWVSALTCELLTTQADAPRSRHLSNAWTGFGAQAEAALAEHGPTDPPFGASSPLAKALAAKGKAVFLGTDFKCCTFLHHLEDILDLPGIGPALVSVADPAGGRPLDVAIPRQVPGEREFYLAGEEARFFREAKARGLEVRHAALGLGTVKSVALEDLYRIGAEVCKAEPDILMRGQA